MKFILSDKFFDGNLTFVERTELVKEFIRELKADTNIEENQIDAINKLAGDRLNGN